MMASMAGRQFVASEAVVPISRAADGRCARPMNVKLAVSTDLHSGSEFGDVKLGASAVMSAWGLAAIGRHGTSRKSRVRKRHRRGTCVGACMTPLMRPGRGRPAEPVCMRAEPAWLPDADELRKLAAGQRPLCFYCVRPEGSSDRAACICEVHTEETAHRVFNFVIESNGSEEAKLWACDVHELPFSAGKLGGHLWDGGILMSAWATTRAGSRGMGAGGAELLEGQRVLELGSGVGLLGLALAGSGIAESVVLTDFGAASDQDPRDDASPGDRLLPTGLLQCLSDTAQSSGLQNIEVRHLDWHDFLPGLAIREPAERFDRLVAADVVYYASDLQALAAALAAHLRPGGQGFVFVPEREWTGPLAGERASAADLIEALQPFGSVVPIALMGHCGSVEGQPVKLVHFTKGSAPLGVPQ